MAAGISERTARKWLARWRLEGPAGLADRSSAAKTVANRTDERTVQVIAALRRLRLTGPEIAEVLGRPLSTVSGILTRIGMGKLGRLGLEPAVRYERERPGELIHIEEKITAARRFYNLSVEELYGFSRAFPGNLVTGYTKIGEHEKLTAISRQLSVYLHARSRLKRELQRQPARSTKN